MSLRCYKALFCQTLVSKNVYRGVVQLAERPALYQLHADQ